MTMSPHQVSVFLSYAHEDEACLKELVTHLSLLKRQGVISTWHDRQIVPGTDWSTVIDQRIEQASIILLLVSADFLASDYCYEVEMKRALERHEAGQARVIPIAVRPADWKGAPFAHLQALPTGARAISTWPDKDEAFMDVVTGLRLAVEDLVFSPASSVRRALPAIWMIPYARNSFFLGRDPILAQLHTHLHHKLSAALSQSSSTSGGLPSALSGLGGIGKTQIAVEYAYRYSQDYQAVFWARAEKHEDLISSYIEIATHLRLRTAEEKEQALIIEAVKRWLQDNSRWLLILDNADDLDLVPAFLPPTPGGHILMTTRAGDLRRWTPFDVEPLSDEQGAFLLVKRAKGKNATEQTPTSDWDQLSPADRRVALALTQKLGGLPLALDQARAYINATQCSLQDYERLYQKHRLAVFEEHGASVPEHPAGVVTTWALSFQLVQEKDPAAAALLRLCAFCAPDAIPEEILTAEPVVLGSALAPLGTDELQRNRAIEVLRTYSLIQRDPEAKVLSVHRLVQAVLRETLNREEQQLWAQRVMLAVNAAFPWPEHATWSRCERLLIQALSVTELIEQYSFTTWDTGHFLYTVATYLVDRARYAEAEPLYQRALRIREQSQGPDHPDVAYPLNGLANLYSEQGKYAEAEVLYQRALRIWEQSQGPDHPDGAYPLNGLASLYQEQGKYEEAEPLYQRALHIWEQSRGPDHPEVADTLNNLANLYYEQGKYAEAEALFQRALHIREQSRGPDHPLVAYPLNGLANLYREQGKYAEAEPLYQRALRIWEQSRGPDHPLVAYPLNGLANLYQKQGKYEEAEPLYQRALRIWEQSRGPDHPDVADALNNLADLYREQGKYAEAEPLFQQALRIKERLSPDHPHVAYALNGLAILYFEQGKYSEAEPLYQRALRIWEQSRGPDNPGVAAVLNNLAILYSEQGKYAEAEPLFQQALRIKERLSPDHPPLAYTLNGLADLYREQARYAEAEPLYQRALRIWEQRLGPDHPLVADALNGLAILYREQGRYEEAEALY